jgi:Leucine-rich repeat (LRR) protein
VSSILHIAGGHQIMVDLSWCYNLTFGAFQAIPQCRLLQYLDVSYTRIADVSPIAGCPLLKGLNCAGISLPDTASYSPIGDLSELQVLILRSSNIASGDPLVPLQQLRSLDLGNSKIASVAFLDGCFTRLEELAIDGARNMADNPDDHANQRPQGLDPDLRAIMSLPSLKVLNVCDTRLSRHEKVLQNFREDLWLEAEPMRYLYELLRMKLSVISILSLNRRYLFCCV